MRRQREEKQLFTRRSFIFTGVKALLGLGVISRLTYLQIFRSSHYKLLSDNNRIVTSHLLPVRGNILDRTGKAIVTNQNSYSIIFDLANLPEDFKVKDLKQLSKYLTIDQQIIERISEILTEPEKFKKSVLLQENVDKEQLASFQILASFLPGISVEKNLSRLYLDPEPFSHITGYVRAPTKEDIEQTGNIALMLPMAKVGKCGIEKSYEDRLFGTPGIQHNEVNARRQAVRLIDQIDSVPGENLHLTIDKELQHFVYQRLSEEESASCIVMDVHSGSVRSFVSYPGYDTNIMTSRVDPAVLKELYENPYKPMINKALSGLYSPGSSFKMITGLAALKKGIINKYSRFTCDGVFELGRSKYHCWRWKYGGHGALRIQQALARSCDVFFYNLAMMLSPDEIAEVAKDFGLGVPTGIDLQGEKTGLIPTKAWKKERKKQSWTKGDTLNMSIGQGFTLATPLQLARMISILVNGMIPVSPHLCQLKEQINPKKLKYQQEHIELILKGMYDVVNDPSGTAFRYRSEDIMFGGKTGSSQVVRITTQQRKEYKTVSDDYWKKEHAVFVGYAPVDSPKYSVCVLVEHGGSGAGTAAPIARDVLTAAIQIFGQS